MNDFKLNTAATKKEIIEQYKELLDAHKKTVREREASKKRLTELEKHVESEATAAADEATVQSVIQNIGRLKGQIGATLNDVVDQMSGQAEKLEGYKRAISLQESRLKELYDIESTADALAKLIDAYEERKQEEEAGFQVSVAKMTEKYEEKKRQSEADLAEQRQNLETAIAEQRTKWMEEKDREKKLRSEESAAQKKEREREESEYVYERDRARKLDQDAYEEKKMAFEKELAELRESADRTFKEREAAITEREKKLEDLERQVGAFPSKLQSEVSDAVKKAMEKVKREYEQQIKLLGVERDWEKKILDQRIAHLQEVITGQDKKIAATGAELAKAQAQVNEVAKKAIEGASLNKAFQSVNQIALEQARQSESKPSD
ncbi:MAG: hypothetical protein QNJ97_07675 [Myxococcota bacterium]|nr:hypothetical protein [Myxococcota bacterium]